jgi:hypothetical protein
MDKVSGMVQYVGTKFNGSLKVNDTFYNFAKGSKNKAVVGDQVTLTLEPWESNGKSGVNIVEVDVLAVPHKVEQGQQAVVKHIVTPKPEMSKDEWASKDRRISRQGCIQVAVQVTTNFDKAVELADRMLEYVNR